MITQRRSAREGKVIVTFEISGAIWTESIHLVGDFNSWDSKSLPLHRDWKQDWILELELDADCKYCFRYLFDGHHWGDNRHASVLLTSN
jgi:hypothetical protein